MGLALQNAAEYTDLTCSECGIRWYVPEHWRAHRQQGGSTFYCPNGHAQVYRESDVQRLRRELAAATAKVTAAQANEAFQRARAETADKRTKRLQRRIAAGVCPCCHRTVQQLARHMATKHPEFPTGPTA